MSKINKILKWLGADRVESIWYYWHSGGRGFIFRRWVEEFKNVWGWYYMADFDYGGWTIEDETDVFLKENYPDSVNIYYPHSIRKTKIKGTHFGETWRCITDKQHRQYTYRVTKVWFKQMPKALWDWIKWVIPFRCHGDFRPKPFGWDYTYWTTEVCNWLEMHFRVYLKK